MPVPPAVSVTGFGENPAVALSVAEVADKVTLPAKLLNEASVSVTPAAVLPDATVIVVADGVRVKSDVTSTIALPFEPA